MMGQLKEVEINKLEVIMNKYSDIINLPRPELKHPRMSMMNRAAQFAPFSAREGYEEAIDETTRRNSK